MNDQEPEYVDEEFDLAAAIARSERVWASQEDRDWEAEADAAHKAMYAESPETLGGEDVHVRHADTHGHRTGGSFVDWLF